MRLRTLLASFASFCLAASAFATPADSGPNNPTMGKWQTNCLQSETQLYKSNCMADYRGSPVFRQRCELLSQQHAPQIESKCEAMLERMNAQKKQAAAH